MGTYLRTVQIVSSPMILDGKPCIENRRISVQQVVEHHIYESWSIEKLSDVLDLRPAEVHAALAYYYDHREEIDSAIRENDSAFDEDDDVLTHDDQLLGILDELLSTQEAAQQLGISERRVRQLCEDGKLPARKLGSNWFIHPSSVDLDEVKNRRPGRPVNKASQ